MSAESSLVFYGVRYEIPEEEVEDLDSNQHPLIKKARGAGLQVYGGNFAEPDEKYFLFVGTRLGILGAEHAPELVLSADELIARMGEADARLEKAHFEGAPRFYVQWMPDV